MRKVIVGLLAILFAFQTSIFVTGEETEQILEECQLNFDGLNANQSAFPDRVGATIAGFD